MFGCQNMFIYIRLFLLLLVEIVDLLYTDISRSLSVLVLRGMTNNIISMRAILLYLLFTLLPLSLVAKKVEFIASKNTITVVELDHNDEIAYELRCGRVVHLKIIDSNVDVIFSTI